MKTRITELLGIELPATAAVASVDSTSGKDG